MKKETFEITNESEKIKLLWEQERNVSDTQAWAIEQLKKELDQAKEDLKQQEVYSDGLQDRINALTPNESNCPPGYHYAKSDAGEAFRDGEASGSESCSLAILALDKGVL